MFIPVKNEQETLPGLAKEIDAAFAAQDYRWEVLWVDDGSTEARTVAILDDAARRPQGEHPNLQAVRHEFGAGRTIGILAHRRQQLNLLKFLQYKLQHLLQQKLCSD
jgi:glycosyltransferase involved in cell wall biosynthesis